MINWTDAFENGAYIPDAAGYPPRWAKAAAAFRANTRAELDLSYGDAPRQRYDLFLPGSAPKGLAVFVHGGYWKAFDKSSWSHLAAGPLAHGYAVALPSYTLAPEARIPDMTREIARMIETAAARINGPIRLAGHSAGGHLVSRMACADTPLSREMQERIARVVSISGLHDLRPLTLAEMNDTLHLTEQEAASESAALHTQVAPLTTWVGAEERPEFLRQTRLLAEVWQRQGGDISSHYDTGKHHFNVIDGLAETGSPLTQALLS